jgi:hypothetical protein
MGHGFLSVLAFRPLGSRLSQSGSPLDSDATVGAARPLASLAGMSKLVAGPSAPHDLGGLVGGELLLATAAERRAEALVGVSARCCPRTRGGRGLCQ